MKVEKINGFRRIIFLGATFFSCMFSVLFLSSAIRSRQLGKVPAQTTFVCNAQSNSISQDNLRQVSLYEHSSFKYPFQPEQIQTKSYQMVKWIDSISIGGSLNVDSQIIPTKPQTIVPENLSNTHRQWGETSEELQNLSELTSSCLIYPSLENEIKLLDGQKKRYLGYLEGKIARYLEKSKLRKLTFTDFDEVLNQDPDRDLSKLSGISAFSNSMNQSIVLLPKTVFHARLTEFIVPDLELQHIQLIQNMLRKVKTQPASEKKLQEQISICKEKLECLKQTIESSQTPKVDHNLGWKIGTSPLNFLLYTKETPIKLNGALSYNFFDHSVMVGFGQRQFFPFSQPNSRFGVTIGWVYGHTLTFSSSEQLCKYGGCGIHGFCGVGFLL